MTGLIEVGEVETCKYDENRSGQNRDRSGTSRGVVGAWSGGGRGMENCAPPNKDGPKRFRAESEKNALRGRRTRRPDRTHRKSEPLPLAAKEKTQRKRGGRCAARSRRREPC